MPGRHGDVPAVQDHSSVTVDVDKAEKTLRRLYETSPLTGDVEARLAEVRGQIAATGRYEHTADELTWLARWAWWSADRCVGRAGWAALEVIDRTALDTASAVFEACVDHLHQANNRGRIRATMSVFRPGVRILNEQLVRYAGYRRPNGSVVGDPRYVGFTELVRRMGWQGTGTAFDVLPVLIAFPGLEPELFELPSSAIREVAIRHPQLPGFDELGLRWHAVPVISHMRLRAAGIDYTAAPFNGWYVSDEIWGNLAYPHRYNLLPAVAELMGLSTASEATRWRQRAAVELEYAIFHSYTAAGIKISDPHVEAKRFVNHVEREASAGRAVPTDWSWTITPMMPGLSPTYHRYYPPPLTQDDPDPDPFLRLDPDAASAARGECPAATTTAPAVTTATARSAAQTVATAQHSDPVAQRPAGVPPPRRCPIV